MISNPVTDPVPDDSAKHLFPTLNTTGQRVFAFLNPSCVPPPNGYQGRDTMGNGIGYWGRFPATITNPITGTPLTRDSMSVCTGWNMVGSISNVVDTSTIVSVPPGIRAGNWFGYSAGYIVVTQITPGKAYWIKANANGKFVMANPLAGAAKTVAGEGSVLDILNTVTVTDSKGGSQVLYFGGDAEQKVPVSLYDMPPVPPVGAFDARFESAEGGSMVKTHGATVTEPVEYVVTVQSDAYPVTVTWTVDKGTASYELTDGQGGKVFRAKEMTGQGSIKITDGEMNRFTVRLVGNGQLPTEYGLSQNYPNPFNPTTSIKYALPVQSKVAIHIYNVLGQRVRTLMNDDVAAGYHIAEWNGTGNEGQQLASGVYFLQMSATGTNGKTFSEIRKLMMLK
jgi:flagellar hook assembly protein FlgD